MAARGGVPGLAVVAATAGAYLMYVGIKDVPVLDGLREITRGRLPKGRASSTSSTAAGRASAILFSTNDGGASSTSSGAATSGGPLPELPRALQQFAGDRYSQLRRWKPGYSDCSSFVGKGFKALGITPPGPSTTLSYLPWSKLTRISRSEAGAGDLAINTAHMVTFTDSVNGIGQQNGRTNVRTGPVDDLMPGPYGVYRYTGPRPGAKAPAAPARPQVV